MSYPDPHPGPYVVEWADWLPVDPDEVPDHLWDLWYAAWEHDGIIDAIWYGEWWCCRELTTGPAVEHQCNVRLLGRSWRSEGCGWRCPTCGAEWTLSIVHKLYEEHRTPYGVHPRSQCGPAFCDLLPPRPLMHWVRDDAQTNH